MTLPFTMRCCWHRALSLPNAVALKHLAKRPTNAELKYLARADRWKLDVCLVWRVQELHQRPSNYALLSVCRAPVTFVGC